MANSNRKSVSDKLKQSSNPMDMLLGTKKPPIVQEDINIEETPKTSPKTTDKSKEDKAKPKAKATSKQVAPKKKVEEIPVKKTSNAGRKPSDPSNLKYKKKSLKKNEIAILESNFKASTYVLSEPLITALKAYAALENVDVSQTIRGALIDAIPDMYLKMAIDKFDDE